MKEKRLTGNQILITFVIIAFALFMIIVYQVDACTPLFEPHNATSNRDVELCYFEQLSPCYQTNYNHEKCHG